MKRTRLTIAATLVVSAVAVVIGGYVFVNSGIYDVSATKPHSRLMYWATHPTMEHSVGARMADNVPPCDLHTPCEIGAGGVL